MSITPVDVRSRTRGRAAQLFSFQGVGKLEEYTLTDKNDIPVRADGKPTEIVVTGEGENKEEKIAEGQEFVKLDRINAHGFTSNMDEVVELLQTIATPEYPINQMLIDGALDFYNDFQRAKVSPKAEEKPDVLKSLVDELVAAGLLIESKDKKKDQVGNWRRAVTTGAKSQSDTPENLPDAEVLEFAEKTSQVRKLRKLAASTK